MDGRTAVKDAINVWKYNGALPPAYNNDDSGTEDEDLERYNLAAIVSQQKIY